MCNLFHLPSFKLLVLFSVFRAEARPAQELAVIKENICEDSVFISTIDGTFYAVELRSGNMLWSFSLKSKLREF
jgi:glucose dehydrogenase